MESDPNSSAPGRLNPSLLAKFSSGDASAPRTSIAVHAGLRQEAPKQEAQRIVSTQPKTIVDPPSTEQEPVTRHPITGKALSVAELASRFGIQPQSTTPIEKKPELPRQASLPITKPTVSKPIEHQTPLPKAPLVAPKPVIHQELAKPSPVLPQADLSTTIQISAKPVLPPKAEATVAQGKPDEESGMSSFEARRKLFESRSAPQENKGFKPAIAEKPAETRPSLITSSLFSAPSQPKTVTAEPSKRSEIVSETKFQEAPRPKVHSEPEQPPAEAPIKQAKMPTGLLGLFSKPKTEDVKPASEATLTTKTPHVTEHIEVLQPSTTPISKPPVLGLQQPTSTEPAPTKPKAGLFGLIQTAPSAKLKTPDLQNVEAGSQSHSSKPKMSLFDLEANPATSVDNTHAIKPKQSLFDLDASPPSIQSSTSEQKPRLMETTKAKPSLFNLLNDAPAAKPSNAEDIPPVKPVVKKSLFDIEDDKPEALPATGLGGLLGIKPQAAQKTSPSTGLGGLLATKQQAPDEKPSPALGLGGLFGIKPKASVPEAKKEEAKAPAPTIKAEASASSKTSDAAAMLTGIFTSRPSQVSAEAKPQQQRLSSLLDDDQPAKPAAKPKKLNSLFD